MIILYDSALSPCAQKVRLVLHEKGLPFEAKPVDLTKKENLQPEYLALNPKGVVPTIIENGAVVTESSIIIEYLDDAHPSPPLRPVEADKRARMRSWIRAVDDELHPSNGAITWPILVLPTLYSQMGGDRTKVEAIVAKVPDRARRERQMRFIAQGLDAPDTAQALAVISKVLDRMESALGANLWIAGPNYSLADAALTPYLQTFAQFGLWDLVCGHRPNVLAWFDRIRARPSFTASIHQSVPEETWAGILAIGGRSVEKIGQLIQR